MNKKSLVVRISGLLLHRDQESLPVRATFLLIRECSGGQHLKGTIVTKAQ